VAAPRFALPDGPAIPLELPARLESWNARDHPDQVALRAWLAHVGERISRVESEIEGELALRLDVGLPSGVDPLWQRDLDNYLYPVARSLPERYVSVWATKCPGRESSVRVGSAIELRAEPRDWSAFSVPQGSRGDEAWKRSVAEAVRGAPEVPPGPVAVEFGFVVGDAARWPQAWKASIDGLEGVLGCTYAEPSWNPQDGRIVRLGMHRDVRPDVGRDVAATVWLRPAPLEWEENEWLRRMSDGERAAYLEQHLARLGRSRRAPRRADPRSSDEARKQRTPDARRSSGSRRRALVAVPGVVVFADDDAAYEAWLGSTPGGFVLNALRSPSSGTVLHSATCRTVCGEPTRGATWTAGSYVKACASDAGALARWLEVNGGKPARECRLCMEPAR
jgi:hypothetical protein